MVSTVEGIAIALGWEGLSLTISHPVADVVSGTIVDTESISTTTNQAGYAETYVVKGRTVTAECPGFSSAIVLDTTGLDSIDLSTYIV
jgi:hypothetical protein